MPAVCVHEEISIRLLFVSFVVAKVSHKKYTRFIIRVVLINEKLFTVQCCFWLQ